MSRFARCIICALIVCFSTSAHALVFCRGAVTGVYVDNYGGVLIAGGFSPNWIQICNVTTSWKGVAPETCESWVALATTLQVTQQLATLRYADGVTCDSLPAYGGAPAPHYVMIAPIS